MSYDFDQVYAMCKCPCGKGLIEYGYASNEWGQTQDNVTKITCPDCQWKYDFTDGGLISNDYPDYKGDSETKEKIDFINDKINNYDRRLSYDEIMERFKEYMTDSEFSEFVESLSKHKATAAQMEIYYAEKFIKKFSYEELSNAQKEMQIKKVSTSLSPPSLQIAKYHQKVCKTIKLSNVLITVNRAVRNYKSYNEFEEIKKQHIAFLKEKLKELENIYYANYDEYLEEKKKHIIPYKLIPVDKENADD